MKTIDLSLLAPSVAATRPLARQVSASTVASIVGDTETTVSLFVYFEKGAGAYRGVLSRLATRKRPTTGGVSLVNAEGSGAPRLVLFSFPGEWSLERLEALYGQAFETMSARAAAGDERVGALLAT